MPTRAPASNIARNARMNPADEPVVTMTRSGSTIEAMGLIIMSRDARPQRRDAERLGIGDAAVRARARAASIAVFGAEAKGCPTSM